ncbi:peroxiredoxin [Naasia sp. SYSU D00948]|uniref:peroxiredoxin n=1 Tax=Naasia sp. SYSU D00948 TaxID=2817379 RepID=UPI001B3181AF|nr:peroxiredoxin [Naasia sp. SYSU D00948]
MSTVDLPFSDTRLHQLEERFAELEPQISDSPVRESLSVLHALVGEAIRRAHPDAVEKTPGDVADLWRTAPPMRGERRNEGLPVGAPAPDFTLPDARNQPVSLSDFRGTPVVLVFYPLDWSPGCSQQLELYQQELDEFASRGIALLGISVDSIYSHGAWAAVRGLTFPLLSDFAPKGEVARRYGVWRDADGFSERALYLVDGEGVIRWAHVSPELHHLPDIYELLDALDRVRGQQEVIPT